ncbi:MAG TPA: methionine synthase [Candidatus Nanopelagicales bacterium]
MAQASDDDRHGTAIRTTGIGSMPGRDAEEATRIVVGELVVPHVAELPARGPGADLLGRSLALVRRATGEFAAETTPSGWRLAGGRTGGDEGRQMRRGAGWLGEDVDRLAQHLQGFDGVVKVQVAGPWTLAAGLESARGTRLLADPGACADLAAALAHAVAEHVAAVARAVPGARVVAQLDEPTLPLVLAGRVRTASGRGAVRVPGAPELSAALAGVVGAARGAGAELVIAHCCARTVPFALLRGAGVAAVSVDLTILGDRADEDLGAWWDAGGQVLLGVAPSLDPDAAALPGLPDALARQVDALWRRIGFGAADVAERTWLTPTCGLAGASPGWARSVGGVLRQAAGMLESAA